MAVEIRNYSKVKRFKDLFNFEIFYLGNISRYQMSKKDILYIKIPKNKNNSLQSGFANAIDIQTCQLVYIFKEEEITCINDFEDVHIGLCYDKKTISSSECSFFVFKENYPNYNDKDSLTNIDYLTILFNNEFILDSSITKPEKNKNKDEKIPVKIYVEIY